MRLAIVANDFFFKKRVNKLELILKLILKQINCVGFYKQSTVWTAGDLLTCLVGLNRTSISVAKLA